MLDSSVLMHHLSIIGNSLEYVVLLPLQWDIRNIQTCKWEPLGALQSTWESPKSASNLQSLPETLGVDGSKRKSLVDTIFRIRREIVVHHFFTILSFSDRGG